MQLSAEISSVEILTLRLRDEAARLLSSSEERGVKSLSSSVVAWEV
jgi:hypothetical protein